MKAFEPIERTQRAPTDRRSFDPNDAPYIAPDGRGGVSRLIETGFLAIEAYNAVLTRYAEGDSLSTIRPDIERFSAAAKLLTTTIGLPGVSAGVEPVIGGLLALADAALAVADRQAFARVVTERAGTVDAFLGEVRGQTPDMFRVAVAYSNARKLELVERGRVDDAAGLAGDLENFRQMLASWVLTIDRTREALKALEAAVGRGRSSGVTIAEITFWTGEINRHAEAVKFAYRSISKAF